MILLFGYLTKPFEYKIETQDKNTIMEKIFHNFLITTLIIAILGVIITLSSQDFLINIEYSLAYIGLMPGLIITDAILMIFFIPTMIILKYIENKVIDPLSKFSEIKPFIKENEEIKSEELLDVYSKYINEDNEIGTLAQAYTNLIEHNNHYIENINEIESEKERAEAELDIATKIQASALPPPQLKQMNLSSTVIHILQKKLEGTFLIII